MLFDQHDDATVVRSRRLERSRSASLSTTHGVQIGESVAQPEGQCRRAVLLFVGFPCERGVGVGWAEQEFDALNVPFRQRGAIKALWTQDVASYEGRFVSFTDVDTAARPVREPHPPIWVGGAGDGALRRTVRYGDGWHPIRIRVSDFKDREIPRLREMADREQMPIPALCPRIRLRITESPMPDDQRIAGEGSLDQIRPSAAPTSCSTPTTTTSRPQPTTRPHGECSRQ